AVTVVAAGGPNMPDLLETGQVDAVEGVIPYGGLMASQGVKIAEPVTALGDRVQMSFWGSHREWAENNREVIGRFKAALDDASAWMKEHPQDAVTLLMAKTGVDKKFEKFVKVPEFTTKLTPEDLEVWKKAMTEVRGFSTTKQMKDLVLGGGDTSAEQVRWLGWRPAAGRFRGVGKPARGNSHPGHGSSPQTPRAGGSRPACAQFALRSSQPGSAGR